MTVTGSGGHGGLWAQKVAYSSVSDEILPHVQVYTRDDGASHGGDATRPGHLPRRLEDNLPVGASRA